MAVENSRGTSLGMAVEELRERYPYVDVTSLKWVLENVPDPETARDALATLNETSREGALGTGSGAV